MCIRACPHIQQCITNTEMISIGPFPSWPANRAPQRTPSGPDCIMYSVRPTSYPTNTLCKWAPRRSDCGRHVARYMCMFIPAVIRKNAPERYPPSFLCNVADTSHPICNTRCTYSPLLARFIPLFHYFAPHTITSPLTILRYDSISALIESNVT